MKRSPEKLRYDMKIFTTVFYICSFLALALSCQRTNNQLPVPTDPDPVFNMSWFKQENTMFRGSQVDCLLNRWYHGQVSGDTITLGIINDQAAYQAFFPCSLSTPLPAIDFNKYTLLIGFKSNNAVAVANVSNIEQNLVEPITGQYEYQVTVTGRTKSGGEWFGFCGLAAKINNPNLVKLKMTYQVK